jgi:hypothetical protein
MNLIEELLKGKFQLPCSEIRLKREEGTPIEIAGPGVIELNAEGKFDYAIHVSAKDHVSMFQFTWQNIPTPGVILSGEHFFELIATSYNDGVWRGRTTTPQPGGTLGQPGLVGGTLSELRFEQDEPPNEVDRVTFFLPGKLDFPALEYTKRPEIRKSSSGPGTITRDHSSFQIGAEEFVFYHEENHTELHCRFEPGSIAKNRHRRLQEALFFALCLPVWPSAVTLGSGGKKNHILYPPDRLATNFKASDPPFHFSNQPPEVRAKFFDIVSAYYRKTIDHVAYEEHPISSGVSLVMQALQSYVDVQVLALAVGAEALVRVAFPDIVAIEPGLKDEIEKLQILLQGSDLSPSFRERVTKATEPFLSASGSDRLHSFIVKFGLDTGIHQAWKKSRNPSAHGELVNLTGGNASKVVERRNKVLYLCHAIVLGFIGYSGPHTRYDLRGYPVQVWKHNA